MNIPVIEIQWQEWACDCGAGKESDVHRAGCTRMAAESRDAIDLDKLRAVRHALIEKRSEAR